MQWRGVVAKAGLVTIVGVLYLPLRPNLGAEIR